MKKFFSLFLFLFIFIIEIYSLTTLWEENGKQIVKVENLISKDIQVSDTGITYVLYTFAYNGRKKYFIQKIDQNHIPLWGEHGIQFSIENVEPDYIKLRLFSEDLFIIWRNPDNEKLHIQKIDQNGNLLWGDYGICFSEPIVLDYSYFKMYSFGDNNGGIFIFWTQENYFKGIHLNSNSSWGEGWSNDGKIIINQHTHDMTVLQENNDFILLWMHNDNMQHLLLNMQKITLTGDFIWEQPKMILSAPLGSYFHAQKNSLGNIFIIYKNYNGQNNSDYRLQYIDNNGFVQWLMPIIFENPDYSFRYLESSSDNNIFALFKDEIYKIGTNKEIIWQKTIPYSFQSTNYCMLIHDYNGGCLLLERKDYYQYDFRGYYIQHYNSEGSQAFADSMCLVTNQAVNKISLKFLNTGNYQLTWNNFKDGNSSINIQVFDQNDTPLYENGEEEVISSYVTDVELYSSVIDYQDTPIIFYKNSFEKKIKMIKIDNDNSLPDIGITVINNYYQNSNSDVIYKTVSSPIIDEIAILSQTAKDSLILKVIDLNGELLYQNLIGTGEQYHNIIDYHLQNEESDSLSSNYLIYYIERDDGSVNHINHIHFLKYQNGSLIPLGTVNAGTYPNAYLKGHYLLLKNNNVLRVKGLDENYNVLPDWPEGGIIINGSQSSELTFFNINIYNENLIVTYALENNLYLSIINPEGDFVIDGLSLINEVDNISIVYIEDRFAVFFSVIYSNNYYSEIFDYSGNQLNDMHPLYVLSYLNNINFMYNNSKYYAFAPYNESELLCYVFDENFNYIDYLEIRNTFGTFENDTYLFDRQNNIVSFWKDTRLKEDIYLQASYINDATTVFAQKISTSLISNDDQISPETNQVFLRQNYPNPFNPKTAIEFSVEKSGEVNLSIYNIKGQKVATIYNGYLEANKKITKIWNAEDVSSGVYLYKLKTKGKTYIKKMLYLK